MRRYNLALMGMGCAALKGSQGTAALCFAVVALAFALTGCYESGVPMKEKGDRSEPAFLGRWVEVRSAEGDDTNLLKGSGLAEMTFTASNEPGEYAVRHTNSSGDVAHFRAYVVEVEKELFLNAQVTEGEADMVGKYFFFRYGINGDQLELRMVSDKFIKQQFATPEELYNFIRENLENEKLCEDPVVFNLTK